MERKALQAFFGELQQFGGSSAQICAESITAAQTKPQKRESKMTVENGTAIVPVKGLLLKEALWLLSFFGIESSTYSGIRADISDALTNDSVKRIVLKIDSPGGELAGIQEAADAIFEARKTKPIDAFIDDLGTSGAYWLGSQAQTITANLNTLVGSIGVYAIFYDFSKRAEKEGIKVHVIRSGEHKGMGAVGAEISEEQITVIQQIMDDIGQNFVAAVARGRGKPMGKIAQLATGQAWLAERAKNLELIDKVGTLETVFGKGVETMTEGENITGEMMFDATTGEWHPKGNAEILDEGAIKTEAVSEEKTRLAELKAAFPDDLAFAVEQHEKGASLTEAKAAYAEVLKVKLATEKKANAEFAEKAKAGQGAQPVEFNESAEGGEDFMAVAKTRAKEEKIPIREALRKVAQERPDLYISFVEAQPRRKK